MRHAGYWRTPLWADGPKAEPISGLTNRVSVKPKCSEADFYSGINGVPYRCKDGKLVVDEETYKQNLAFYNESEKRRRDLAFALRSRILTDKEMQDVIDRDFNLFIPACLTICSYDPVSAQRQFNEALLQQFKLRVAASQK